MAQAQQAGQPNRKIPGGYKPNRFNHEANTKYGMGDNYGTGIKAKVGRMRDGIGSPLQGAPLTKKQFKTPPKNLA
jgi:hypothetical protein